MAQHYPERTKGTPMITLKIASDLLGRDGQPNTQVWIPEIRSVSRIGQYPFSELEDVVKAYGSTVSYLAYVSTADAGPRPPGITFPEGEDLSTVTGRFTLLWVVFNDGREEYVLVERAWLIGPSGGTIDRVAP